MGAEAASSGVVADRASPSEEAGTIAIELNFNAFADNCPPDRHARRVPNYGDPSVQDFADQALELAALRAELKRLTHDYDVMARRLRLRDARLETLRRELASAQAQLRDALRKQSQASAPPTPVATQVDGAAEGARTVGSAELHRQNELTCTLPLAQTEPSDSLPPLERRNADLRTLAIRPQLIPLDQQGGAIKLSRDIVTIGRTRNNDICIRSRAVSRDHARLLVSRTSVIIVDIDSANGCFVNDQPVKRHKLQHGDLLRIGDHSYRFVSAFNPATPRTS